MTTDFNYPVATHLLIGKSIAAQGLRGEVVIASFSGQPENMRDYRRLFFVSAQGILSGPFAIDKYRVKGKTAIVQLAAITERNAAETLVGQGVLIYKDDLPTPGADEFYVYQWEGLTVVTDQGRELGTVKTIFSNGAQEILVVKGQAVTSEEFLIPVMKDIILHQDGQKIVIAPPPGLLEMNAGEHGDKH